MVWGSIFLLLPSQGKSKYHLCNVGGILIYLMFYHLHIFCTFLAPKRTGAVKAVFVLR